MPSLGGAIKFCLGQTGRDLIHEARLIDRVMQAGAHPNIVPLTDAHLDGDTPWLLFEYVGGGSLTDWMHALAAQPTEKRIPQVLAAFRQLAEAVAFFYALPDPIVHRDLKPSNILLDRTKRLRITDFGIGGVTAKETNRQEYRGHSTRGGRLLSYLRGSHTPIYSSPQQRRGDDPDPRDDVHALGVIAYQMFTGKLDSGPGPSESRTLAKGGLSAAMLDLILSCVSEDLDDRPANAVTLVAALDAIADAEKVEPAPKVTPVTAVPAEPKPIPVAKPVARKAGDKFEIALPSGVPMTFAWCPPGTFRMGSPESEPEREENEAQHTVTLTKGFYMGVHPVTQAQWEAVMGSNPSHFKGANLPVEQVSWEDTQKFFENLKFKTGQALRLPTEAEWEYAARGGTTTPFYFGAQLNGTQANCDGNYPYGTETKGACLQKTTPVGSYAARNPHPWGLADVTGNVWEWCQNLYDGAFYGRSPESDPVCADSEQKFRALRGSSWYDDAACCRTACHFRYEPAWNDCIGFRVCFTPEQ